MLVFRHSPQRVRLESLLRAMGGAAAGGRKLDLLLQAAQFETALADFWHPDTDRDSAGRRACVALVLAVAGWRRGAGPCPWPDFKRRLEPHLPALGQELEAHEAEGFRFYALHPDRYLASADEWLRRRQGHAAWVIGLRTAGTALGATVAAHLAAHRRVRFSTLRPRGHPFDRQPVLHPSLEAELRSWSGDFLVVDEGPGLSGSSFDGTASMLSLLGAAHERIWLFPSWPGNETPQWRRWNRIPAAELVAPVAGAQDIGAGKWRQVLGVHRNSPAWGAHERAKFLRPDHTVIYKFAGFGDSGSTTMNRARRLARAGYSPEVAESGDGWIGYRRLAVTHRRKGNDWVEFAAAYLAHIGEEFTLATGPVAPSDCLQQMVHENVGIEMELPPAAPQVALDGRTQPQEWGWAEGQWWKFDATDHGDDPFFPGPADMAWDLAAIEVEFGPTLGRAVSRAYARRRGESWTELDQRVGWYRIAYLAFRHAYSRLAASQTEARDATRWSTRAQAYAAQLAAILPSRHCRRNQDLPLYIPPAA